MFVMPPILLAIEDDNDREFMEYLYLKYQRLMYSTIYQIVQDTWLTDDIIQNSLIKLIDNIPKLRSLTETKLINYIISVSKNTAFTQLRKNKSHTEIEIEDWLLQGNGPVDSGPEAFVIKKEDMESFSKVWKKLDDRSRYLLRARFILKKSYAEMADELGVKPESVRMAITRARRTAHQKWVRTLRQPKEF